LDSTTGSAVGDLAGGLRRWGWPRGAEWGWAVAGAGPRVERR